MAKKRSSEEEQYYKHLQKWIEKKGYFTQSEYKDSKGYINKSIGKIEGVRLGRIDVVGIKNIGNKYTDDIEIVGIEAKIGNANMEHIGQALKYSLFLNKTYLAVTGDCSDFLKRILERVGMGLIYIKDRKTSPKIDEIISPSYTKPEENLKTLLLAKLGYYQCMLCKCYVPAWSHLITEKQPRKTPKQAKRFVYPNWLDMEAQDKDEILSKDFDLSNIKNELEEQVSVFRYLCKVCAHNLKNNFSKGA